MNYDPGIMKTTRVLKINTPEELYTYQNQQWFHNFAIFRLKFIHFDDFLGTAHFSPQNIEINFDYTCVKHFVEAKRIGGEACAHLFPFKINIW